ncbi:MAG: AI-2E family transporter [Culicoidibacterales bacterium]
MKSNKMITQLIVITIGSIIFKAVMDFPGFIGGVGNMIQFFQPFFVAFGIAYILYPFVRLLQKHVFGRISKLAKVSYGLSILVAYISLIIVMMGLVNFIIPEIGRLIGTFANIDYAALGKMVQDGLAFVQSTFGLFKALDVTNLTKIMGELVLAIVNSINFGSIFSNVINLTSTVFTLFVSFILSIYMLMERSNILTTVRAFFSLFIEPKKLDQLVLYLTKSNKIFILFLSGQALDSLVIGIIATIGFYFLEVPLFLGMGLVVMVFNMIPMIGPVVGAVPAIILTLMDTGNFTSALWVGLFMLCLQQLDGNVIGPKIVGSSVGVSVFWIITAITIMGTLFGFIGLLFAVPVAGVIKLLFTDYYRYRNESLQKMDK